VTKSDDYNWPVLKPDIFAAMMDHFSTGEPLFTDKEVLEASDTAIHEDDDEVRLRGTTQVFVVGAGGGGVQKSDVHHQQQSEKVETAPGTPPTKSCTVQGGGGHSIR